MLFFRIFWKILTINLFFIYEIGIAQNPILAKDTSRITDSLLNASNETAIFFSEDGIARETSKSELENTMSAISKDKESIYVQFETKVLFESGAHGLSHKDRSRLLVLADELKSEIKAYQERYPHEKLVLVIGVVGYTDEKPFYAYQSEEERKNHNLELSRKRAHSASDYLKHHLHTSVKVIENFSDGQGEELPHYVNNPQAIDAQRRSCIIHALIYNEISQVINDDDR